MLDEGTLRERFPEIPWDQPVLVTVIGGDAAEVERWTCRYCIALHGLKATDLSEMPFAFFSRSVALDHIDEVHHD